MNLTIRDLTKTYPGGVRALDGVSLDIPPGLFGLLGPNGAGKTTLMNTLATLQTADGGEVRLGDIDLLQQPDRVRAVLGYLPQEFGVYPGMSGEELLDYLARLKGLGDPARRRAHVGELLEIVNLTGAKKRAVATYSGGMRQRFGIAQALLGSPRLVIVDEPTAGLDPAERHRFHAILSEISAQVIVLLSTHIVEDVANLCRTIAIMHRGKVVAQGTPESLCAGLRGRLWQRSATSAEIAALNHGQRVISAHLHAGAFRLVVESASPPAGFTTKDPDLEDVYFHHVPQEAV
ncbi:MAG TPA: ABC transporter ATP-binding protein [Lacunisphaera sp.]|nr:ABC transporter ATP-binding protein [Lacunisphaera sp.]